MLTSLHNEKVKHARALAHQRKARGRHRQFVVEGVHLLQEAERAGIQPALIFCTEAFYGSPAGARIVERWASLVELVSDKVMASLSDTVTPQGVLSVVPFLNLEASKRDLILLIDNLRDPGNVGALLRSALAAGVDEALISPNSVDLYAPKVVRSAMGAHFRLPARDDLDWSSIAACVAALPVLLADAAGEIEYDRWDWRKPSVLIVGGEAEGASPAGRALATHRIRIPMRGGTESLNAAVAGSVILFEAARQRRQTIA